MGKKFNLYAFYIEHFTKTVIGTIYGYCKYESTPKSVIVFN